MEAISATESASPKNPARVVIATALLVAAAMVALGWTTNLRLVMRGALLAASVVAFLPFVVIAVACALLLVLGIVLSFAGEAGLEHAAAATGERGAGFVSRSVRGYYRFLRERRHPAWLGAVAGIALGTLACWALLAAFVLPLEARTLETLVQAQMQIDADHEATGRYVQPDANGHLTLGAETLTDAFGKPVLYQLQGRWKAQSYRLMSLGADGQPGGDDLCVSGRSALAALAAKLVEPLAILELLRGSSGQWSAKLEVLRSADCERQAR